MNAHIPLAKTTIECPNSKRKCDVNFEINVFRGVTQGGMEAVTCTEFLDHQGIPTCGKECVHLPQAHRVHEQAVRQHQQDLSMIGPNVIG